MAVTSVHAVSTTYISEQDRQYEQLWPSLHLHDPSPLNDYCLDNSICNIKPDFRDVKLQRNGTQY